jgi:hypothetical protein
MVEHPLGAKAPDFAQLLRLGDPAARFENSIYATTSSLVSLKLMQEQPRPGGTG